MATMGFDAIFVVILSLVFVAIVAAVATIVILACKKGRPVSVLSDAAAPPATGDSAERAKIFGMLEEGKIDADEAERLIEALDEP